MFDKRIRADNQYHANPIRFVSFTVWMPVKISQNPTIIPQLSIFFRINSSDFNIFEIVKKFDFFFCTCHYGLLMRRISYFKGKSPDPSMKSELMKNN